MTEISWSSIQTPAVRTGMNANYPGIFFQFKDLDTLWVSQETRFTRVSKTILMWIKLSFVCNGFWPRLSDCVGVKKNSSSFVVKHCLGRGLDPLRSCSNLPAATYPLRSCSSLRVFQYLQDSFKWSFWIILVVEE